MSASFAPLTSEDSVALESAAEATVLMTVEQERQWEQPVRFLWAAIGASSQRLPLPCGPAVEFRSLIVPRKRRGELHTTDQLRAWNGACILRLLRATKPQSATDISGAIALAGEVAKLVAGLKVLVIFSDFQEELPRGQEPTTFRLSSERVVMLYRPEVR